MSVTTPFHEDTIDNNTHTSSIIMLVIVSNSSYKGRRSWAPLSHFTLRCEKSRHEVARESRFQKKRVLRKYGDLPAYLHDSIYSSRPVRVHTCWLLYVTTNHIIPYVGLPATDNLLYQYCLPGMSNCISYSASIRRITWRPYRLLSYWGAGASLGCLVSCCILDV